MTYTLDKHKNLLSRLPLEISAMVDLVQSSGVLMILRIPQ
jgi:hypothetical protein